MLKRAFLVFMLLFVLSMVAGSAALALPECEPPREWVYIDGKWYCIA